MNDIKTVGIQDLPVQFKDRVIQRIEHFHSIFEARLQTFDELSVTCKPIHQKVKDAKPIYEFNINLILGSKVFHGHSEDHDAIVAVNKAFDTVSQSALKE